MAEEILGPEGVAELWHREIHRGKFGSQALKLNGKIFAMLAHGRLVVKLRPDRVAALIGAGIGLPFDAGKGRPMKEWVSIADGHEEQWLSLALEARQVNRLSFG